MSFAKTVTNHKNGECETGENTTVRASRGGAG